MHSGLKKKLDALKLEFDPDYNQMKKNRIEKKILKQRRRVLKEGHILKSELMHRNRKTKF